MSEAPSQNLEAEESVLGAIFLKGSVPNEVIELLTPKQFYWESHGTIYKAAMRLHARSRPTTAIAVADELDKMGMLEAIGGGSRLAELAAITPSVSQAPHYAAIVKEMAQLRDLHNAGLRIAKLATERPGDVEELMRMAEELLYEASAKTTNLSAAPINAELESVLADIKTAIVTQKPIMGIPTGFTNIDAVLHGMWPGQLIILAALTGKGKSTFALNIAENVVDFSSLGVLLVSLEMSRRELLIKSLSRSGGIDSDLLSTGLLRSIDQQKMPNAIAEVTKRKRLLVHDQGLTSPAALANIARRHHETDPLGLIVVDYIGLMQGVGESQSLRIASISRALKVLAMDLNVPVLALAQFNRQFSGRTDKRPMLTDLKDTSSLEQDADVVLFLHNEADHDVDKEDDGSVTLIVAKNRRGKSGDVELLYTRRHNRFAVPHRPGDTNV